MIVTIKVLRLLSKSKYFTLRNDKLLISPHGVNFSIFYQLLCQDLNLYSTNALQNRKLDKTTRDYERNRLTAVHAGLDMAKDLFKKYEKRLCPEPEEYRTNTNMCIYEKQLRMFVELVLHESLNIIEQKGIYRWETLPHKKGLWREFTGNKLIPMDAETTIDNKTQKTYIKFSPIPNIIV
ncbi:MAG: hypothetical protein HOB22_01155 [Candidatus Marinimicrobia bacterium]|nr:hypothetical protein [Candidatus Neomarinimicrobiota bacterium]